MRINSNGSLTFVVATAAVALLLSPGSSRAQSAGADAARAAEQARAAELRAQIDALLAVRVAPQVEIGALELQAAINAELAKAKVAETTETALAAMLAFDQQRPVAIGQGAGAGTGIGTTRSVLAYAESGSYDMGLSLLDNEQWQRAIEVFDRVIKSGKSRVDGAMYWKAYALDKLGQRNDALAVLQEMQKAHPASRWLDDAKALEIQVRQNAGQSVKPEDHANEDLKLLAINSLMRSDPERAIPMLQQVLKDRNSPKVKERALFVLAQSDSAPAREAVAQVARGGGNPDLQMKALRYLAMFGKNNAQTLADIYAGTKDVEVKREILRSLAMTRATDRIIVIAKNETTPELRIEAIRQLGMPLGRRFGTLTVFGEGTPIVAGRATGSVLVSPRAERRAETEAKDKPDTKAITDALVQIYRSDKDGAVRKQIISTLSMAGDAKSLVDLARAETDPVMKKEIVSRLATMKSKEATDYMLELLK